MHLGRSRRIALFTGLGACTGSPEPDANDSTAADTTATATAPSTGDDATPSTDGDATSDASTDLGDSSSDPSTDDGSTSDTGDDPPPGPLGICDDDGVCSFPETCSTCPDECGSCEVADLPNQRAKYVDQACDQPGDGLVDSCAAAPGAPGRFDDLQVGLDSLEPGDTLFVHPGDYWRQGDSYRIAGLGTEAAPIVITAANPDAPPVIHSWDPAAPNDNASSHTAIGGAEQDISWIIVDNLVINGLIRLHGDHTRIQNVECYHGWEVCDGNWSCIRLEGSTDGVAHHNYVHDVFDTTGHCSDDPGDSPPRESGLKEFDGVRTIWEFNTIVDTARGGYDLHRSSVDSIARFNLFRNAGPGSSIRMNRTGNQTAYGNVVLGGGTCIDFVAEDPGDGFTNVIDHNTCLFTSAGVYFNGFAPATVTHNVFVGIGPADADNVMLAAAPPEDGVPHLVDHNAYDASSEWTQQMYEYPYWDSLTQWQADTQYDAHSIAASGGACNFTDVPTDANDGDFDLSVTTGSCIDLAADGGAVGACAVTSCVGHDCSACGF